MTRKGSAFRKRGGIAGIIAALILFVILFTVGTGYFLWISYNNSTLSQAQANRVEVNQQQGLEELQVIPGYCGNSSCKGDLNFTIQNTGDVAVTLQSDFVNTASGICNNTIGFLSLNPGSTSTPIDAGCKYSGNPAVINVLTQRGNVFSATYYGSEITTSLSANPVMAGQPVFDTATLTDVSANAGGNVTYSYFPNTDCSQGSNVTVSTVTVTNGTVPNSVSESFSTAGLYSWNANYTGDISNPGATSSCEPLTVQDSITTQLSSTKIVVGNSVYDSASLTGVTATAGGTVNYYDYTNAVCSAGKALVATVTVSSGSVPSSGYSSLYLKEGLYSWDAVYSGDGTNKLATSPCEPLTVVPGITTSLSSSTIYQLGSVYDTAVLGGATPAASGNVTYYYSTIDDCPSVGATQVGKVSVTNGNVPNSAPVQFTSAGNYYWYAVYTGDSNNYPSTSPCEPLSVLPESGGGGTGSLQQVVGSFKFYFANETDTGVNPGCNQSNPSDTVPNCLGDGVSAGGYYAYGVSMSTAGSDCPTGNFFSSGYNPSCVDVVFQITLTNTDPTRSITLGPQSLLWLQGTCQTAVSNGYGYFFARGQCSSENHFSEGLSQGYWIVDGPPGSSGYGADPRAYSSPVVIAPGQQATLYFYCAGPCTSALVTPTYNPPPGTYVEASLDLYGMYSDNTPFGQNIPFIATYISPVQITGCAIGSSYTAGTNTCWTGASPDIVYSLSSGEPITLAVDGFPCTSVATTTNEYGSTEYTCTAGDSFPLYVNWVSSTGSVIQVGTSSACIYADQVSGGSPGYCTITFQVPPSAAPGNAYAIYVTSDGVNNAYATVYLGALNPSITLTPTQGPMASSVTVDGTGFSANTAIGSIAFSGGTITTQTCTSQTTDGTGAFTCTFTVPQGVTIGAHTVTVSGSDIGTVPADTASTTFTVMKSSPTITTTVSSGGSINIGSYATDSGTFSGGAGTLTGTLVFTAYTSPSCSGTASFTSNTITVDGNGPYTSNHFTATSQGTYYWQATFTDTDGNNNGFTSGCGGTGETLTVGKATPTITTTVSSSGTIDIGSFATDSGTFSGAYGTLTGTLVFSAYTSSGCSNTASFTSNTITVDGNGPYTSNHFTATSQGTYYWQATFTDTDGNNSPVSTCGGTGETLKVNPSLVPPVIKVTPATVDKGQSASLTTTTSFSGGTSPYTCQWLSEAPGGAYVDLGTAFGCAAGSTPTASTGALSTTGTWSFELQVTDSGGASATSNIVTVTVNSALSAGTLSATHSPVDVGETTTIMTSGASGGSGSYTYSWTNLPSGCSSSDSASISCTPTSTTGSPFTVTLTVTDSLGGTATATLTLTIKPALVVPTPTASVNPANGHQSVTFTASPSGGSGTGTYTYVWAGLPPQCTASNSGTITCTPTTAGTYTITVTVTDSDGDTITSGTLSFTVT